uniref:F-box protein 36b n=1 Tax=Sphaeramia orbicularis TaxID=375764 RepID=A0A673AQY9_9TELE
NWVYRLLVTQNRSDYILGKVGQNSSFFNKFLKSFYFPHLLIMGNISNYAKALCQGHYDYLERLSDSLLLQIINYLELEDVGQLGRTSRRFRQLCGSEGFWETAVRQRCNTVSAEVSSLALEVGWRHIFFTNKLQLQKYTRTYSCCCYSFIQ